MIQKMRTIKDWQVEIRAWAESKGFNWSPVNVDTMLLRLHSEVSEASEAVRDGNWRTFNEELADIFIRLADLCEVMGVDLNEEVKEKMVKNYNRPYRHGHPNK